MILRPYGAPPVYRLRAAPTLDSYGDPVDDWAAPARTLIRSATVQADSSEEDEGQTRRILTDRKRLFAPGSVDLTHEDRVEYLGEVYRVEGDPVVRSALSGPVYTSAVLVRMSN